MSSKDNPQFRADSCPLAFLFRLVQNRLWATLLLLGALTALGTAHLAGLGPLQAGEKSWKISDELTAEEKREIDERAETPRNPAIPYLPEERYPFAPPYTAEEMGYLVMEFSYLPRWSALYADVFETINKNGNKIMTSKGPVASLYAQGLNGFLYQARPGEEHFRWLFMTTDPPELRGTQFIYVGYRTDRGFTKRQDVFEYLPSMRKVRRLPPPRRQDRYPNTAVTYDDYLSRDAWEFHWRLLGTDTLFQTVRFPKTRKTIRLLGPDGSPAEVPTADLKMMGEKYPHYTPGGGVACYVLEARPRQDWLPNYYCSKLIYWVDRHVFYPLRMEQYDAEGKLFLIEERMARQELPELGRAGYAPLIILDWDLSQDLLTYDLQDGRQRMSWPEAERKNIFNPEFMRREQVLGSRRSQAEVRTPKEFYLRPLLYREKFPQGRKIEIPKELEERIRAQEAAGHLVF